MRRRVGLWLALLVLPLGLRSAMAREVLRANPRQCLRLEKRVVSAELKLQARPESIKAQQRFYQRSRKYATRCVHLNEIQVLGTHNSYHIRPKEPLWSLLLAAVQIAYQLD